jgi:prepilin-type N-terminal cleavage/methylation domain-containing protein/prepilin-type processing-associated H-X9-DG protein
MVRARLPGFTLIELLVVIAIIAMLMGLLMVAIQYAREAGRRAQCTNNLKQIATAFHHHHQSHDYFPTGGWGCRWIGDPDRGFSWRQPGGWLYNLLPYVEQSVIHDLGRGKPNTATEKYADAMTMTQLPISLFNCPSRRAAGTWPINDGIRAPGGGSPHNANLPPVPGGWARADYQANAGDNIIGWGAGPDDLANGEKKIGFIDMSQTTGIVFQGSMIGSTDVPDGLSNTYLVGEKYLDSNSYFSGLDYCDDNAMVGGDDLDMVAWTVGSLLNDQAGLKRNGFGGPHPGLVIMAFADGSVRALPVDTDPLVHKRSGNRRDTRP